MTQRTFIILTVVIFIGCSASDVKREITTSESFGKLDRTRIDEMKAASPFLKAHMKNGNLYVFRSWDSKGRGSAISGKAVLLSTQRDTLSNGEITLGLDSIALLETNVITSSGSATALTIFTGITAALTINCLVNPKSCFGSCPTFYASDGDSMRLQAEGFSSSILPSLEAIDVDALYHVRTVNREVILEMRNEALETHIVRHADLLAVPKQKGCRVFAGSAQQFWESNAQISPLYAKSPEGDCLPALIYADGNERFSLADEVYLGTKETIECSFHIQPGQAYGLVIGCRQTLLPTYLLYQTYAYMGNDAGRWLAEIERKNILSDGASIGKLFGGIEVTTVKPNGQSKLQGSIDEHGPLAVDMHVIPLGKFSDTTINIQLRMTKGAWRLDYLALAELSRLVEPIRLHPRMVLKDRKEDQNSLFILLDSTRTLVTLPGDSYTLKYSLPDSEYEYELFLESRGYYLEWIRKEWIEEQNPFLLAQMFLDPENALKRLAPEFKHVEPNMEDCFWRSRYARP